MTVKIQSLIQNVPDFPKPGIIFKDISPLLNDVEGYRDVIDAFAYRYAKSGLDVVVGIESRGFLFAATLAYVLKLPLALVRKAGKLPDPKISHSYALEYGTDTLELHESAIQAGTRALLIDDLLATGGTALAACELIEKMGGEVIEIGTVIELAYLHGREKLKGYEVFSQLVYETP